MKTVNIPGASFPVSKICLGCANFGTKTPAETSFDILDFYFAQGGRFFNTAHEYGQGKSEQILGQWIRTRGNRDQLVITTKGGQDVTIPGNQDMRHDALIQDMEESLQRLGIDYVDFYLLHMDDPSVGVAEILETLEELVKAGKTRHYGCSNWSVERQREAAAYAKAHGLQGFVIDEIEWSLAHNNHPQGRSGMRLDEHYIALHEEDGICVGGYSPLASGFFNKVIADGDLRNCHYSTYRFINRYNFEIANRLRRLCEETGFTPTQLQLAWLLNAPYRFPSFLIMGASRPDQLEDALRAFEIALTPEMIDYLHPPFFASPDDEEMARKFLDEKRPRR